MFEIYDSKEAYESNIETADFKKYKTTTQCMVTSLELTDVIPLPWNPKIRINIIGKLLKQNLLFDFLNFVPCLAKVCVRFLSSIMSSS